jgi:hypothetical protein
MNSVRVKNVSAPANVTNKHISPISERVKELRRNARVVGFQFFTFCIEKKTAKISGSRSERKQKKNATTPVLKTFS